MNITDKYKMMFFAPDEGGGEGGPPASGGEMTRGATAFEPVTKTTTGEPPLPAKTGESPASSGPSGAGTGEGEQPPAAPAGGFDPEKFAKEFGATFGESIKPLLESRQAAEPAAPTVTPEEARKILNVWEPDDNWYAQYDNLETRKDAVAQMRDALITQADTLAQFRMREAIDQLRQEIMPGLQTVAETTNQQREQRLFTTYPLLGKPEMRPLIDAIANDLVARKQTFKNETELFTAVAKGVEAVMKVNNPEFKLEAAAATNGDGAPTTADRGGRQLPVTTPGGGGSTGRRENDAKPVKPRGLAVFDK